MTKNKKWNININQNRETAKNNKLRNLIKRRNENLYLIPPDQGHETKNLKKNKGMGEELAIVVAKVKKKKVIKARDKNSTMNKVTDTNNLRALSALNRTKKNKNMTMKGDPNTPTALVPVMTRIRNKNIKVIWMRTKGIIKTKKMKIKMKKILINRKEMKPKTSVMPKSRSYHRKLYCSQLQFTP